MKTIIEIQTPLGGTTDEFIKEVTAHNDVDAVVLCEEGGLDAIVAAERLRRECDKEIFLKIACRDRNRIALRSQIITAAAAGFTRLLLVDGVHPVQTAFPDARPVYELDSLGLLRMIKQDAPEFGPGVDALSNAAQWTIAACIGGATPADVARAKKFLEAGADMLFAHSVESVTLLRQLTEAPIILSVRMDRTASIDAISQQAGSAGADGISIVIAASGKAFHGNTVAG